MFAIAFDLMVEPTERHHPKGLSHTYRDIGRELDKFGFRRVQGSVYVTDDDDLANLFGAIMALKGLSWLPPPSETYGLSRSSFGPILRPW